RAGRSWPRASPTRATSKPQPPRGAGRPASGATVRRNLGSPNGGLIHCVPLASIRRTPNIPLQLAYGLQIHTSVLIHSASIALTYVCCGLKPLNPLSAPGALSTSRQLLGLTGACLPAEQGQLFAGEP